MSDDVLLVEYEGPIATVTLNRPAALNAANAELHKAIAEVWGDLAATDGLRAVVLTGAGKAFSAGGDLPLLQAMTTDLDLRRQIMLEASILVRALVSFPHPIIAAVNGPAVGLGCSLASLSDVVVMEEQAFFADPHVALGLVAGDGGAITWPMHIGLQRSKEWLLLGDRISAQEAQRIGLANRVVAKGESVAVAKEYAARFVALPPQSLAETRKALNAPMVTRVEELVDGILKAETESFDAPEFRANLAAMLSKQPS